MSDLVVFDLSTPTPKTDKPFYTGPEWESREAYQFVVSRLGKYIPWDPKGWPNEVADEGCRCRNHYFKEKWLGNQPTGIWVCSECDKPKPLMNYVEWCVSCGIPYVVRISPDRVKLCGDCNGE
jgi:hypothetical protein